MFVAKSPYWIRHIYHENLQFIFIKLFHRVKAISYNIYNTLELEQVILQEKIA